ncbi:adenosine receptor A2b-like [Daphnia carinata]|uniref:adenosine receptor A2b-like n=1 Tax=Daphnia carinata TaxID=120202 RepID=UPI002579E1C9|nr:adenosine receptor A2b-like [Daphnia carinata]
MSTRNTSVNSSSESACQLMNEHFDITTGVIVSCNLLISLFATFGNLLVIVAVVRYSILRTPTNHFVAALALADLLVGLVIPFYVSFYFDLPDYACNPTICQIKNFVAMWTTLCSFMLLIGVALDRYVSIIHPLAYPRLVSRRISRSIVAFVCLYVTGFVSLPYLWTGALKDLTVMTECDLVYISAASYAILFCAHLALSLTVTTLLYAHIFREAWRQNRHHLHREAKTALMMVLIFGVNIVSTLPYLIVVGIRYRHNEQIDQTALSRAKKVVMILYFGKSAINPLIYGWKNREFRLAFARLLRYVPCSKWAMERSLSSMEVAAGMGSRAGSIQQSERRRSSKIYQLELPPIEWTMNANELPGEYLQQAPFAADEHHVTHL